MVHGPKCRNIKPTRKKNFLNVKPPREKNINLLENDMGENLDSLG